MMCGAGSLGDARALAIQRASQPASWTTWSADALPLRRAAAPRGTAFGQRRARGHLGDDQPGAEAGGQRRNGASVMPDIGASITGFGSVRRPMASGCWPENRW